MSNDKKITSLADYKDSKVLRAAFCRIESDQDLSDLAQYLEGEEGDAVALLVGGLGNEVEGLALTSEQATSLGLALIQVATILDMRTSKGEQ